MGTYVKTYRLINMSLTENCIGLSPIPVVCEIEGLGGYTAYLHAEIDENGVRKVEGMIQIDGKTYECALYSDVSGIFFLVMPLDDGSYWNTPRKGEISDGK